VLGGEAVPFRDSKNHAAVPLLCGGWDRAGGQSVSASPARVASRAYRSAHIDLVAPPAGTRRQRAVIRPNARTARRGARWIPPVVPLLFLHVDSHHRGAQLEKNSYNSSLHAKARDVYTTHRRRTPDRCGAGPRCPFDPSYSGLASAEHPLPVARRTVELSLADVVLDEEFAHSSLIQCMVWMDAHAPRTAPSRTQIGANRPPSARHRPHHRSAVAPGRPYPSSSSPTASSTANGIRRSSARKGS